VSSAQTETPEIAPTAVEELLNDTRTKMEAELEEVRPAHEAFLRLEQILSNFDQITSDKPARKGGNGSRAPRGSRSNEFLQIVRDAGDEGVTVAEAADKMDGINPNYLYRIAKDLTEPDEGDPLIRKDDKRYFAIAEAAEAEAGTKGAKGDGEQGENK
jgi:transposase-like protein